MAELSLLLEARSRAIRGTLRTLPRGSAFKIALISVSTSLLLLGLFFAFWDGFTFVRDKLPEIFSAVSSFLFGVFFFALFLLLALSCGVIFYGGLFRGKETSFLYAYPLQAETLFSYKFIEAVFWASWAFLFLSLPLLVAFGLVAQAPASYYAAAVAFLFPFVVLAGAAGALGAVLVTALFLAHRKRFLVTLALLLVAIAAAELIRVARVSDRFEPFSQPWIISILEGAETARGALLPSGWMTKGMHALAAGNAPAAAYSFLLLLANALFFGMLALRIGGGTLRKCYDKVQSLSSRKRFTARPAARKILAVFFPYLSDGERELILKDVRTFRRDAAQWSQFLIFFGLLAVYFVNIRRLGYDEYADFWKNLVSFLNMAATAMTLATFTSRFVFPQVSLEGKRFWVLGLAPLDRSAILRSKFAFSVTASAVLSVGLITVSDAMLRVNPFVFVIHVATMIAISLGLSGLAVGLGARFPSLREDNPSKIVAGFGGTLNLVASAFYVALVVGVFAVPCHLYYAASSLTERAFGAWIALGTLVAGASTALATVVPYSLGARAFRNMEI
ncbi:MAG: hypothetical protein V2A58_08625 [Planctomycetota bacterium]